MKKLAQVSLLIAVLFVHVTPAFAARLAVSPFLLDLEAEPREILTRDIELVNNTAQNLNVYATVNEIAVDSSGEIKEFVSPVMTDRTNTVTSWVEISRARIKLDANGTTSIPLTLRIHPYAEPGEYHLFIGFVPSANRPNAQAVAMNGDADGVIVKVTIVDTKTESLHITDFDIKNFILNAGQTGFEFSVENIGDAPAVPTGEIIFYNSRGEEVGAVEVNTEGVVVSPGQEVSFPATVPFSDKLGRFKANLTLNYGEGGKTAIFDTTQFYMAPYHILGLLVLGIVFFSVLVTVLLKRFFDDEEYMDDGEGIDIPLRVQTGREIKEMEHDISLK